MQEAAEGRGGEYSRDVAWLQPRWHASALRLLRVTGPVWVIWPNLLFLYWLKLSRIDLNTLYLFHVVEISIIKAVYAVLKEEKI